MQARTNLSQRSLLWSRIDFFLDLYNPTELHVRPISLPKMAEESLDDLLNLEESYYQEGYDLGEADGAHAGLVEGKLFGVEKGFEKAMSMGRLSGRADVWGLRLQSSRASPSQLTELRSSSNQEISVRHEQVGPPLETSAAMAVKGLPPLSTNARLGKHVEDLLAITESGSLSSKNSDEAVADFDGRLTKAKAKAKVITNIIAEPLQVEDAVSQGHRSIEESGSLSARH